MGHQAAEAKTLYFEPSRRRQPVVALIPEAAGGLAACLGESPNSLTATAARRDDGTLHARLKITTEFSGDPCGPGHDLLRAGHCPGRWLGETGLLSSDNEFRPEQCARRTE